jgi:hypothetical protein
MPRDRVFRAGNAPRAIEAVNSPGAFQPGVGDGVLPGADQFVAAREMLFDAVQNLQSLNVTEQRIPFANGLVAPLPVDRAGMGTIRKPFAELQQAKI